MKAYVTRQSQTQTARIYVQLLSLLSVEKLYLDPNTTAALLAQKIGCEPRNISAAVQASTGANFPTLINSMRLREVCKRLTSPRYADMTVEDIGLSCGYKSRQAFYTAFHRLYDCTPKEWREGKVKG